MPAAPVAISVQRARGVTLVELLVVLMLIGLLAGVVGLTLGSTPSVASLDPVTARVMAARDSALRVGRPVSISIAVGRESHRATAFPDGRVLTDARLEIDALSGTASAGNASAGSTSSQRTTGDAMR